MLYSFDCSHNTELRLTLLAHHSVVVEAPGALSSPCNLAPTIENCEETSATGCTQEDRSSLLFSNVVYDIDDDKARAESRHLSVSFSRLSALPDPVYHQVVTDSSTALHSHDSRNANCDSDYYSPAAQPFPATTLHLNSQSTNDSRSEEDAPVLGQAYSLFPATAAQDFSSFVSSFPSMRELVLPTPAGILTNASQTTSDSLLPQSHVQSPGFSVHAVTQDPPSLPFPSPQTASLSRPLSAEPQDLPPPLRPPGAVPSRPGTPDPKSPRPLRPGSDSTSLVRATTSEKEEFRSGFDSYLACSVSLRDCLTTSQDSANNASRSPWMYLPEQANRFDAYLHAIQSDPATQTYSTNLADVNNTPVNHAHIASTCVNNVLLKEMPPNDSGPRHPVFHPSSKQQKLPCNLNASGPQEPTQPKSQSRGRSLVPRPLSVPTIVSRVYKDKLLRHVLVYPSAAGSRRFDMAGNESFTGSVHAVVKSCLTKHSTSAVEELPDDSTSDGRTSTIAFRAIPPSLPPKRSEVVPQALVDIRREFETDTVNCGSPSPKVPEFCRLACCGHQTSTSAPSNEHVTLPLCKISDETNCAAIDQGKAQL